jgi:hypothetical protein
MLLVVFTALVADSPGSPLAAGAVIVTTLLRLAFELRGEARPGF